MTFFPSLCFWRSRDGARDSNAFLPAFVLKFSCLVLVFCFCFLCVFFLLLLFWFFFFTEASDKYTINSSFFFSKDYLSTCNDQVTLNNPKFPFIALVVCVGIWTAVSFTAPIGVKHVKKMINQEEMFVMIFLKFLEISCLFSPLEFLSGNSWIRTQ